MAKQKNEIQKQKSLPVDVEPTSPQTSLLKEGASIVRLENMTQMQMALQRPRDENKIMERALASLDRYPAFAEKVHYLKPVGKDDEGKMKYAEGLSIRAAESLQALWDNSASGCEIVAEDDDSVTLAGVFLDYERNIRHPFIKKVSRYYKTKDGKIVKYAPDRFADVVLGANQSKLLRETILRSLPAELKMAYSDKAKEIMRRKKPAERKARMVNAFVIFGIKKEQLETYKNKPLKDWTDDDMDEMQGIYNALKDEETTIEQVFGKPEQSEEKSNLKIKTNSKWQCQQGHIFEIPKPMSGTLFGTCPECGSPNIRQFKEQ